MSLSLESGILILIYLITAFFYTFSTTRELNNRIKFSVRPISEGQDILLITLIVIVCGSLHFSCAKHIEREGFSIPQYYTDKFMKQLEKQIELRVPAKDRPGAIAKFREKFQRSMDEFSKHTIKPYERFILWV